MVGRRSARGRLHPGTKETLRRLARASRAGLITVGRAVQALGVSSQSAAALMARLSRRGWLTRARRGLYLVLPLEAGQGSMASVEDPWVLATELFAPCFIDGWTAAEHWGLTEQIFRSTFVATAATVRRTTQTVLGAEFRLARVHARRVDAAKATWRGALRVPVSDRETTLADALAVPAWVGGVRHLADMLAAYRTSTNWSPSRLMQCLEALGSGAGFKRLGFLGEALFPEATSLIAACRSHRTSGNVKLDPGVKGRGRLSKRWGLWANVTLRGPGGGA